MFRPALIALAVATIACAASGAFAQTPIPDSPVPGIGGRDTRPGSIGGSPGSSGSGVGSNVGGGASAAPVGVDPPPHGSADTGEPSTRPLIGLSREIPVR